jgi:preprotein translocase SecE subunit
VTWPRRSETRYLTIVVIGISVFVGGVLGIVDLVLVQLVKLLTGSGF